MAVPVALGLRMGEEMSNTSTDTGDGAYMIDAADPNAATIFLARKLAGQSAVAALCLKLFDERNELRKLQATDDDAVEAIATAHYKAGFKQGQDAAQNKLREALEEIAFIDDPIYPPKFFMRRWHAALCEARKLARKALRELSK